MKRFWIIFKYFSIFALICSLIGALAVGGIYLYLEPKLPPIESLKDIRLQVPLRVFANDSSLIAEFGEKRRSPLDYPNIPQRLVQAFIAAEDARFYEHPGVDYQGLMRAVWYLIKTGERGPGGSTITMQVARNFFLSSEKTYLRKFNEILLSLKIERELDKNKILELYLNRIYLGNRAYGVGAAAQVYYGKEVSELTLAQMAMIAALPKAPSRMNPIANPSRSLIRRAYVLGRMLELKKITEQEYQEAMAEPITAKLHNQPSEINAPYLAEMVRSEMVERYGNDAYTHGYEVYTTIIPKLQDAANRALHSALISYDRRHGYRGPEATYNLESPVDYPLLDQSLSNVATIGGLVPAIITAVDDENNTAEAYLGNGKSAILSLKSVEWARKYLSDNSLGPTVKKISDVLAVGDQIRLEKNVSEQVDNKAESEQPMWQLTQIPEVAGAFVSLNPNNGAIIALTGGFDFLQSKFNRVTQAKRQPGSGMKPFIYSAALDNGFTPASLINDAPVVFDDPSLENTWRPENYSGKFYGPTRLREALTYSRNLVSIRLLKQIGPGTGIDHLVRFGFKKDQLPRDLSLALGSASVTPLELATGYCVIANGGYNVFPHFITRIVDSTTGDILYSANPVTVCRECKENGNETLSTAEDATSQSSAEGNSASLPPKAVRAVSEQNIYLLTSMMQDVVKRGTARRANVLKRNDLAGKTGTTNEARDAWFNGFNSQIVASAWVGFDQVRSLGNRETGGRAALPMWIEYMKTALDGMPEQPLKRPPGLVSVRINRETGLQTNAKDPLAMFEIFREENIPPIPPENSTTITPDSPYETQQGDDPIF